MTESKIISYGTNARRKKKKKKKARCLAKSRQTSLPKKKVIKCRDYLTTTKGGNRRPKGKKFAVRGVQRLIPLVCRSSIVIVLQGQGKGRGEGRGEEGREGRTGECMILVEQDTMPKSEGEGQLFRKIQTLPPFPSTAKGNQQ